MTHPLRLLVRALALVASLGIVTAMPSAQTPSAPSAPVPLSATDAKALLGDWTIAAEGPNGALVFALTLKAQAEKTVGEISSDIMALTPITDVTKLGDSVMLRYAFDYQGNMVPTVVTLTPAGDTLKAYFDFADGAFTMPGTGTRKKS